MGGVEREGEHGGGIGMAIGRGMGAVQDRAAFGGGAVVGVQILANVAPDRNEQLALFHRRGFLYCFTAR